MNLKPSYGKDNLALDIEQIALSIVTAQKESGEIPWSQGEKTDPWDLVEAIMGLSVGGYYKEAALGFEWMKKMQLEDGSWFASYKDGIPLDKTRDTNMSSYIAVGVYHHYLITKDILFLEKMWDTVKKGIDFALSLQTSHGEIHWAKSPEGIIEPMALLTGSSSVFMSLKCALAIAKELNKEKLEWKEAALKLRYAIKHRMHAFNISKFRYSMDWFYPILCGAITEKDARKRIDKFWKKFVIESQGILCVSDEPWVTIAETSEFVLSLSAMGNKELAHIIFNWIQDRRYEDGSYWCGFTFPDMVIWPEHKYTWTNGVVLMAADVLYKLTPASEMFDHKFWDSLSLL